MPSFLSWSEGFVHALEKTQQLGSFIITEVCCQLCGQSVVLVAVSLEQFLAFRRQSYQN